MLDIYICEDDKAQRTSLTEYISNIIMIESLDMRCILSSANPHEILHTLSTAENIGVFFLDIDLQSDMDGFALAKQIRSIQPRCFISFITSHVEMGYLTFQHRIEALDFIVKDTPEHIRASVRSCLFDIERKHHAAPNPSASYYTVVQGDCHTAVNYQDILFFETSESAHKITLHAYKELHEFAGNMKDLENKVGKCFFRCHRSYLINKDNIEQIDYNRSVIHMKNGEICPISVRAKKELRKLFSADK